MLKLKSLILVSVFFMGCGAIQNSDFGVMESSRLIIRSDSLVGSSIQVGDGPLFYVSEKDLVPYQTGVMGVKDRGNELLETVLIELDEGTKLITIKNGNRILFEKELYVGKGQTRELRLGK